MPWPRIRNGSGGSGVRGVLFLLKNDGLQPISFGTIVGVMELTLHIPDSLAQRLAKRFGMPASGLEEVTLSILSKLADEPSSGETPLSRSEILNRLTERLTVAGVYDLPTE